MSDQLPPIIIMKFGGSITGSPAKEKRIKSVRILLEKYLTAGYFIIPIFSALRWAPSKTEITSRLLESCQFLTHNSPSLSINQQLLKDFLYTAHLTLINDLKLKSPTIRQNIETYIDEIITQATEYRNQESDMVNAALAVHGERLVAIILQTYFSEQWYHKTFPHVNKVITLTGSELGIVTDDVFADAEIIKKECYQNHIRSIIYQSIKQRQMPIITGFDGITEAGFQKKQGKISTDVGEITTLGRGGSDLTATYIANVIKANSVCLVKDTPGVQIINPTRVPTSPTLAQLPYELAVAAGNIQRKAIAPAVEAQIPIELFKIGSEFPRTVVADFPIEPKIYLITDPKIAQLSLKKINSVTHFSITSSQKELFSCPLNDLPPAQNLIEVLADSTQSYFLIQLLGIPSQIYLAQLDNLLNANLALKINRFTYLYLFTAETDLDNIFRIFQTILFKEQTSKAF